LAKFVKISIDNITKAIDTLEKEKRHIKPHGTKDNGIICVFNDMGGGKTLYAVYKAVEFLLRHPDAHIFTNIHLKTEFFKNRFTYTPFGFIPDSKIQKCFILFDDFYSLKSKLRGFTEIIVNKSRKRLVKAILTTQYYTYIPKSLRFLSKFIVFPRINENGSELRLDYYKETAEYNKNIFLKTLYLDYPLDKFGHLYDTFEVVETPLEEDLIAEIPKFSYCYKDLKLNVMNLGYNDKKTSKILKDLIELTGFYKE